MSPAQWVSVVLLILGACLVVGVFVEIARDQPTRTQAEIDADVEALLRGEK